MLKSFLADNVNDVIFMRNSFRNFIYVAFFLLLINFSIVGMLFYQLFTIKPSTYFATTTDGRIINIYPE